MKQMFDMVAKTQQGLEEILAEELRNLGASMVEPGLRMVSFQGTLETLYKANFCCRTALRILKPFYKFNASSPEELYERCKDYNWAEILGPDKSFVVDTVAHSEEFTHSRYATYRVKDAICDWFTDHYGDKRPRVSTTDPDIIINLHISGTRVTLSLDSSGEPLYKRGYRVSQTDAPLNEVLAAGIILKSGWRGETPFIDPMCGSGTFLIEAAMIAGNINPGIFRSGFAFEKWRDFDAELFEHIFNDDSKEHPIEVPIIGADISPKAIAVAAKNTRNARLSNIITLEVKGISDWTEAPEPGVLITNPPYGERLNPHNISEIYSILGSKLKHVFKGYHAWILGYHDEYFHRIGLAPSIKMDINNGGLECKVQEYIIFEGTKKDFRREGGMLKRNETQSISSRRSFGNQRRPTPGERFKKAFDDDSAKKSRRRPESAYPFKKDSGYRNGNKTSTSSSQQRPRTEFGKEPTLPSQSGPMMRGRRSAWEKKKNNHTS